ncbi:MAG: hypothetical protein H0T46_35100 [Deltaproteobacteria bacterium]|nr:hypothetical protein [Deltaproteobacteria bacterium]
MKVTPLFAVLLAACPAAQPIPPKRPNTELITGVYERHKPDGETAIRFDASGSYRVAKNRMQFDIEPPVQTGTYKVAGDQLTLIAGKGQCAESSGTKEGVYKIVLSKIGIRFTKVSDSCERRAAYDGQTWWRVD